MNDNLMPSSSAWHCRNRARPHRTAGAAWLHAVPGLLAAALLASCAQAPAESRTASNVITADRLNVSTILSNRFNIIPLITGPLADAQSRVTPNATKLLSTPDGVALFSFIVSCALPLDAVLVATIDGNELDFFGEIGLTPQWQSASLDLTGQRWVSACLLARVNAHSVLVPFSARGPNLGLAVSDDERDLFTLEEGAFYGNVFVPADQPIQWFACRGKAQAAGETGGLIERDCAEPDPAKPSITQCGFGFAGDCGSFAPNPACEVFSNGKYYQRCHTAPIHGTGPDAVFEQVITTFVIP
jgi:hypothetical protein